MAKCGWFPINLSIAEPTCACLASRVFSLLCVCRQALSSGGGFVMCAGWHGARYARRWVGDTLRSWTASLALNAVRAVLELAICALPVAG